MTTAIQMPLWASNETTEVPETCKDGEHRWIRISDDFQSFVKQYGADWRALWSQQPIGQQVVGLCQICKLLHFKTEVN